MKFYIITDPGQTYPYVHTGVEFKELWPREVVEAAKRYDAGSDAIAKIDKFTLFKFIGAREIGGVAGNNRNALLNTRKGILIFVHQDATKKFESKEAYIHYIFRKK